MMGDARSGRSGPVRAYAGDRQQRTAAASRLIAVNYRNAARLASAVSRCFGGQEVAWVSPSCATQQPRLGPLYAACDPRTPAPGRFPAAATKRVTASGHRTHIRLLFAGDRLTMLDMVLA